MRISFKAKTNKDYVMINALKLQLRTGSILTLDRQSTEFTIGKPNESGKRTLDMEWFDCYLWEIDEVNAFEQEFLLADGFEKVFVGATLTELELEDDADEDYSVMIDSLSINGVPVFV